MANSSCTQRSSRCADHESVCPGGRKRNWRMRVCFKRAQVDALTAATEFSASLPLRLPDCRPWLSSNPRCCSSPLLFGSSLSVRCRSLPCSLLLSRSLALSLSYALLCVCRCVTVRRHHKELSAERWTLSLTGSSQAHSSSRQQRSMHGRTKLSSEESSEQEAEAGAGSGDRRARAEHRACGIAATVEGRGR